MFDQLVHPPRLEKLDRVRGVARPAGRTREPVPEGGAGWPYGKKREARRGGPEGSAAPGLTGFSLVRSVGVLGELLPDLIHVELLDLLDQRLERRLGKGAGL
jgi:hypothetical protein